MKRLILMLDLLCLLLVGGMQAQAQNPGGISTAPAYWTINGVRQSASTAASASAVPYNTQAVTIFVVYTPNNVATAQGFVALGAGNDVLYYQSTTCTAGTGGGSSSGQGNTTYLYPHRPNLLALVGSSSATRFDVNGVTQTGAAFSAATGTGIVIGAAGGGAGYTNTGALPEVIEFNSALSSSDITAVENYLSTSDTLPAPPPSMTNLIVYEGNSLVYGINSTQNQDVPTQVAAQLTNNTYGFINLAIPGTTTPQVAARETGVAAAISARNYANTVVVLSEITNDIQINNVSGATAYANIKALALYYKSLGARVILLDCMSRSNFTSGNLTAQAAVNASLAADFAGSAPPPYADVLVRVSAAPPLQNTSDTTYFSADGIHLTNIGYGVWSSLIATAVNNLRLTPTAPTSAPALPSGCALLLRADTGLYKDAGKTQPATASGDVVVKWADQSGNGNDATRIGGSTGTALAPASFGTFPSIAFNATTDGMSTPLSLTGDNTIIAVSEMDTANSGNINTVVGGSNFWYFGQFGGNYVTYCGGNSCFPPSGFRTLVPGGWVCEATTQNRLGVNFYVNGNSLYNSSLTTSTYPGNLYIGLGGFFNANGQGLNGKVAFVAAWPRVLSSSELAVAYQWIQANIATQVQVVHEGNSVTQGAVATGFPASSGFAVPTTGKYYASVSYAALLAASGGALTTANTFVYDAGVSGGTATQELAAINVYGRANSLYSICYRKNVYANFEVINDISGAGGASVSTAVSNMQSLASLHKAFGFDRTITITCTPNSFDVEASRQAVNAALRAGYVPLPLNPLVLVPAGYNAAPYTDIVCDVGNDPVIGQPGQNLNTTYFNADGVHPVDAGHAIFGKDVGAALCYALLGNVSATGGTKRKLQ